MIPATGLSVTRDPRGLNGCHTLRFVRPLALCATAQNKPVLEYPFTVPSYVELVKLFDYDA